MGSGDHVGIHRVSSSESRLPHARADGQVISPSMPTQCEIILLLYTDRAATFSRVSSFRVPSVFEPFSAMTQDELRGSLVGIPSGLHERVGIYITDKNTDKAICIDTGLALTFNRVPQALLSSSHLVLYTETLEAAHFVTYDLLLLRSVLKNWGLEQDDPELNWAIKVTPSNTRTIPFDTTATTCKHALIPPCHHCGGLYTAPPGADLSQNRDPYPIIIPKWTTLREDFRRHRTRSVVTLSKRARLGSNNPPILDAFGAQEDVAAADLAADIQGIDELDDQGDELGAVGLPDGFELGELGNFGDNPQMPHIHVELNPHPHAAVHFPEVHPRELTTITHHYFDYSPTGSDHFAIKRTVLAQALLRRPQVLRLPWPPAPTQDPHWVGIVGHDAVNEEENTHDSDSPDSEAREVESLILEDDHPIPPPLPFDDPAGEGIEAADALHLTFNDTQIHEFGGLLSTSSPTDAFDENGALLYPGDGNPFIEVPAEVPDAPENHVNGIPQQLQEQLLDMQPLNIAAAQALAEFATDPFGGCPVIGYGGRCALWMEEQLQHHQQGGSAPVLRLATFPAYERPPGHYSDRRRDIAIHPELERGNGHVATLHVSEQIALDCAYAFDLDDIRGLVGIATSLGELWIVHCS